MGALPKVSVCVIAYNHGLYIEKCLESIVAQEVDFCFEVIVADDCSTDATRIIINDYIKRYPGVVRAIFHEANVGVCENYKSAHDAARGEYVAHCDGDDYWYPGKLKQQVKVLDDDPSAVQCWACADVVDDNGNKVKLFPSRLARLIYPRLISSNDIALSYALVGQHSTQLYRRSARPVVHLKNYLDYWVAFNLSLKGKSIYLKSVLGAYRFTSSPSITRNTNSKKKAVDYLAQHLVDIYKGDPRYGVYVKANLYCRLFFSKLKGHDVSELKLALNELRRERLSVFLFLKSLAYFTVQKI